MFPDTPHASDTAHTNNHIVDAHLQFPCFRIHGLSMPVGTSTASGGGRPNRMPLARAHASQCPAYPAFSAN